MKHTLIVVLLTLGLSACSDTPGATGPSATGDGSARVGLQGAPPASTIFDPDPGANPGLSAGNSCPNGANDAPVFSANGQAGDPRNVAIGFSKAAGQVKGYHYQIRSRGSVFIDLTTDAGDVHGGRLAQAFLQFGTYEGRAQTAFQTCAPGPWSEWVTFSVNAPPPAPAPAEEFMPVE